MKKKLFFLSSLFLLLAGCSNYELDNTDPMAGGNTPSAKIRWYGVKSVESDGTKSVADGAKRWNQDAGIFVKFINPQSCARSIEDIKQIAQEWEQYAGIKFNFVDTDKKADVRIAFDWNGNDWLTWSYVGTDAKFERSQSQPTAVLAGLQYLSDEEFRGDVLRLFGQILGLEYEQRHQEWSKNGYWRSEIQLQNYWVNQFDGYDMDWEEIREYVFAPLTSESAMQLIETKEIDELSIMAWPYYNRQQTTKLLANYELSEGDKAFIAQLYPKSEEVSLPTIQSAWVDAGFFVWGDETKTWLILNELGHQQEYLPDVCDGEQLTFVGALFELASIKRAPKFNTSNVTDFSNMFLDCFYLTSVPEYDTSKSMVFIRMFKGCSSLTNVPHFDTSNGTDFSGMFDCCYALTNIPFIDTSNGTNFDSMFRSCDRLSSVPLLDTSNGTNFQLMLCGCNSLINVPFFNTSNGVNFNHMFAKSSSLTNVPDFDTSKGIDFGGMFYGCSSLTAKPNLDLSQAINLNDMYLGTPFQ